MPIYEFQCPGCRVVEEKIGPHTLYAIPCKQCKCWMPKILSVPAVVRIAGEGVNAPLGKRSERIQEPVWRDTKTNKVTSMY